MIDSPAAETRPSPRCSVCFEGNTSWSAYFGAIPLGRFATVSAAWDAIDKMAASRVVLMPAVVDVRDTDDDESEEEPRDDGGEPDRRHRHARQRGRSAEAREHRTRRWRERAPGANHRSDR